MTQLRRLIGSNVLYEVMIIAWILVSPLAIKTWVQEFEDPVTWAAFIAGVLGVFVGWLAVAPYQLGRQARRQVGPPA